MTKPGNYEINKSALNALTDLYYLYADIAFYISSHPDESPETFDIFYMRGGLRDLIIKYFSQNDFTNFPDYNGILTHEKLNLKPTVAEIQKDDEFIISSTRGLIKGLNDAMEAYGIEVSTEVKEVCDKGRRILEDYKLKRHNIARAAHVDLASAPVEFVDSRLQIGTEVFLIEPDSLQYFSVKYLFEYVDKGGVVSEVEVVDWIKTQPSLDNSDFEDRAVKDALRGVNEKIQKQLETELKLFDLSKSGKIIRNY